MNMETGFNACYTPENHKKKDSGANTVSITDRDAHRKEHSRSTAQDVSSSYSRKCSKSLKIQFMKHYLTTTRPWEMYPLGVMFGLGFDTSSEVALLGIASVQGAKGTSIWLILIFPVLFTGQYTLSPLFILFLAI